MHWQNEKDETKFQLECTNVCWILQVAGDAYTSENLEHENIQKQLVDIFTDGLSFDFLIMKVLRENPRTLKKRNTSGNEGAIFVQTFGFKISR